MDDDISEAESKAMFERLRDWFNEECGMKVITLITYDFDEEYIQFRIFDTHIYNYEWDFYGDFLFGHEYMSSFGKNIYHIKSVFETVEQCLNAGRTIDWRVELAFRKLILLKGVSGLAELELRLAAMGEN